jgi:hypothetical protein
LSSRIVKADRLIFLHGSWQATDADAAVRIHDEARYRARTVLDHDTAAGRWRDFDVRSEAGHWKATNRHANGDGQRPHGPRIQLVHQ